MTPTNADKINIGQLIAERFIIKHIIGKGAMGCVYYAEDILQHGKPYAIKILYPHLMTKQMLQRFAREAKIGSQLGLKSRNIVKVLAYGFHDNKMPYYVMELLEGNTLQCLLREKTFSMGEFINIVKQICLALKIAHEGIDFQGKIYPVVHRDLKPANIMITSDQQLGIVIKILDFGIAKLIGDEVNLTKSQEFIGTLIYCSPEQIEGKTMDFRSDIYSLGVLMFEMLTGENPWGKPGANKAYSAWFKTHLFEHPRSFADVNPQLKIPLLIERLIHKCLEKNPDNRFNNIEAIINILNKNYSHVLPKQNIVILPNYQSTMLQNEQLLGQNAANINQQEKQRKLPPQQENNINNVGNKLTLEQHLAALDLVCGQTSWPKNKPIAKIVFPQTVKSENIYWPVLWVMLSEKDIIALKQDKITPENHKFVYRINPHPVLLWISVVYGKNHDPNWLPCFLDLKSQEGQAITSLLIAKGVYKVLFFAQEQPGRCSYIKTFILSQSER
ncbi:MAG TPA: serine/threonine-protein kinase, partial [Allocoleopsis sp.]